MLKELKFEKNYIHHNLKYSFAMALLILITNKVYGLDLNVSDILNLS